MTALRAKRLFLPALILPVFAAGLLACLAASAQTSSVETAPVQAAPAAAPAAPAEAPKVELPKIEPGREASFLPPPSAAPAAAPVPAPVPPPASAAAQPAVNPAPANNAAAPATNIPAAVAAPTGTAVPPASFTAAAPAAKKGVEIESLEALDADSGGVIGSTEGGLGAAMWKGTPRLLVEQLMPSLLLPTLSVELNNLALRFLMTAAVAPSGGDSETSLSSLRAQKLLALGDARAAWKFIESVKPDQIDEITLRMAAEAALVTSKREEVCVRLKDIVLGHSSPEWEKLLLVCQLAAQDNKEAQLTIDLMHSQNVRDDIFFYVAEKNILGGIKTLPRQLTPLKPATLALLLQTGLALPGDIYPHPDATLVRALLEGHAREETARIGLAERAAERGMINGAQLGAVYRALVFTPAQLDMGYNSPETGPRLHALLYQAATAKDTPPANKIAAAVRFMQNVPPGFFRGTGPQALAAMVDSVPLKDDLVSSSAVLARIFIFAGKPERALEWMKLTKRAAGPTSPALVDLAAMWPLTVFAGLENDKEFAGDLGKWMETSLKNMDPRADSRMLHDQMESVLLLFDALGFAVPDEAFAKLADAPQFERRTMPPAFLFERLRAAAAGNRRGEAVLMSLLMAGNNEIPLFVSVEIVKALRAVGLAADAGAFAREAAIQLLMTPLKQ